jgi:hypothetical protein
VICVPAGVKRDDRRQVRALSAQLVVDRGTLDTRPCCGSPRLRPHYLLLTATRWEFARPLGAVSRPDDRAATGATAASLNDPCECLGRELRLVELRSSSTIDDRDLTPVGIGFVEDKMAHPEHFVDIVPPRIHRPCCFEVTRAGLQNGPLKQSARASARSQPCARVPLSFSRVCSADRG